MDILDGSGPLRPICTELKIARDFALKPNNERPDWLKHKSVQTTFMKSLHSLLFPTTFAVSLRDKIVKVWSDIVEVGDVSEQQLVSLEHTYQSIPLQIRMGLLKTQIGSWTTSTRMSEPQELQCLFGCDSEDRITHYAECDVLWSLCGQALGIKPSPFISSRLCIINAAPYRGQLVGLVHHVYHYCKHQLVAHPQGGFRQPEALRMVDVATKAAAAFASNLS